MFALRIFFGFLFATSISGLTVLLYPLDPNGSRFRWRLQRQFGSTLARIARIRVQVRGLEQLPPRGVIFCANHTHNFDIFVLQ